MRPIRKILEKLGNLIGKEIQLPVKFTIESMTKHLNELEKKIDENPEGVITSDEYTKMRARVCEGFHFYRGM